VELLATYLCYVRNIPTYSILGQIMVHHDKSLVNKRVISYICGSECRVNVELFNATGLMDGMRMFTSFESLSCKLLTPDLEIPFTLGMEGSM